MDESYALLPTPPGVEDYCRLRVAAGLSPKTVEAARVGLAATYFGVSVVQRGALVGMGRIVGDGGCFLQLVDIAVLPEHQGKGIG
ncbi:MAG TPA: GNAT family N-acetyltransferase, partial [Xanthobacteraceae bacterium]|nr:GNAT family N-acetyltransferase [Xanthobacteraceae bacterium]